MSDCLRRLSITRLAAIDRCNKAASRPRAEHVPRRISSFRQDNGSTSDLKASSDGFGVQDATGYSLSPAPPAYSSISASTGQSEDFTLALSLHITSLSIEALNVLVFSDNFVISNYL